MGDALFTSFFEEVKKILLSCEVNFLAASYGKSERVSEELIISRSRRFLRGRGEKRGRWKKEREKNPSFLSCLSGLPRPTGEGGL